MPKGMRPMGALGNEGASRIWKGERANLRRPTLGVPVYCPLPDTL